MTDASEPFDYSTRLLLTFFFAALSFVSISRSGLLTLLGTAGWVAATVHLFRRFGLRGGWALFGAPFALYWVHLAMAANAPTDQIVV